MPLGIENMYMKVVPSIHPQTTIAFASFFLSHKYKKDRKKSFIKMKYGANYDSILKLHKAYQFFNAFLLIPKHAKMTDL